ncbi:hypothetical protein CRG98_034061 [Punica granatum]|uniref:Uncharacterized protein n=1 Tax=Punica granatum TaxID=22663 RepID=A0A2I0IPA1_PUNGR|nr:hypothetical protein CRG98_034061 [Punica granatum]
MTQILSKKIPLDPLLSGLNKNEEFLDCNFRAAEVCEFGIQTSLGFYNAVDNCGPTNECSVLLDGWRELGTLYVEDGATWIPECDGGLEEIPIYASGGQQGNISYERSDIVAIDRAQRRPYAGNLLTKMKGRLT